jgi:predicted esterase
MREHELRVQRSARYYTLGDPAAAARELWVACHGYGQLAARFARPLEALAGGGRVIAVPEGLSRFYLDVEQRAKIGASWMTREHRLAEITDYVAYLDAVVDAVAGARAATLPITALGFSQGASTVSRWAVLGRHRVARLILWGGELPPDLDLAAATTRLAGLTVELVRGSRDELITAKIVAGIVKRLEGAGIAHRVVEFDGGHEIPEAVLRQLERAP